MLDYFEKYLNLPGHVYIKDFEGKYLFCNDLVANSLNLLHRNDIIGKTDFDNGISKLTAEQYHQQDALIIKYKSPMQFYNVGQNLCEGGNFEITYFSTTKKILQLPNGHSCILGISMQIDEQEFEAIQEVLFLEQNFTKTKNLSNLFQSLSKREVQCLVYLVRGYSANEIGKVLFLSKRTIEEYIERLKNKFNCHSKQELIMFTFDHGISFCFTQVAL